MSLPLHFDEEIFCEHKSTLKIKCLKPSTSQPLTERYVITSSKSRKREMSHLGVGEVSLRLSLAGVAHLPLITPHGTPQSTPEVVAAHLPRNSDHHCAGHCRIDTCHTVDAAYHFHGIVSLTTAAMWVASYLLAQWSGCCSQITWQVLSDKWVVSTVSRVSQSRGYVSG